MNAEKRIALLKMGYFPVTDDFWAGAGMPMFIGKDFDWAFRLPRSEQPFMPYREAYLDDQSNEQAAEAAFRNLLIKLR